MLFGTLLFIILFGAITFLAPRRPFLFVRGLIAVKPAVTIAASTPGSGGASGAGAPSAGSTPAAGAPAAPASGGPPAKP